MQLGTFTPNTVLKIDPVLAELVSQVDSVRIYSILDRMQAFKTRYANSSSGRDSLARSRDWLISQFTLYGYTNIEQHTFTSGGNQLQNIIVTKTGTLHPDSVIILCGHYDTVNGPGINDNGTGTAIVLEVARILAEKQLEYSVRFICFSAEEQGLVGSNAYVQQIVVPQQHKLKLILNIDEVGGIQENQTNIVKVEKDNDNNPSGNNAASAMFTDTLAALTRTYSALQTTITNAFGTDYVPFENAGYVITGYYEYNQTPHYHQPTDSLSHVDMHYVKEICKGTAAGIAHFAGIKGKFLSMYHTPLQTSQDTVHGYNVVLETKGSSTIDSAKMFYSANNLPFEMQLLNFTGAHNDTMTFAGIIPVQQYGTNVRYYFSSQSADSVTARLPNNANEYFSFYVLPDTVPPSIEHTPQPAVSYLNFPLQISSAVSDANGIHAAWIEWNFHSNELRDTMNEVSLHNFVGTIHSLVQPRDTISYVIYAEDNSLRKNIARFPQSGVFLLRVLNSFEILHNPLSDSGNFSPNNDWQFGNPATPDIPPSPTGLRVWGTNLDGNYSNNTVSLLETQTISLHLKNYISFVFKHYYRTEPANDGGNVQISVDGGAYQLLIPQGGYPYANIVALSAPGFSGNSFVWKEEKFDLSAYRNHNVQLRWKFASDPLTSFRGWYIDAVRLDFLEDPMNVNENISFSSPQNITVLQNYPNPFNPSTVISFHLSSRSLIHLQVFDILGNEVASLFQGEVGAGKFEVPFSAAQFASGVYYYQLQGKEILTGSIFSSTQKMILTK